MSERMRQTATQWGKTLRQWRRMNNIKQESLAATLGVSQSTIAKWESMTDMPSPPRRRQVEDLMAKTLRDDYAIARLQISRQTGIRALIDMDGLRLRAMSQGYCRIWPMFCARIDQTLADHAVNEARLIASTPAYLEDILRGEAVMASGVTTRHFDVNEDSIIPHRWHMSFRSFGARMFTDVSIEPCHPDTPTGITEFIRISDMGALAGQD